MIDSIALPWHVAGWGLALTAVIAFATWLASLVYRDVSLIDRMWALMIVGAGLVYATRLPAPGPRTLWALALALVWAVRLAAYITVRNWNAGEEHRYRAIRERNQPNFEFKSLYLVFALQALLAWVVSAPLLAAPLQPAPLNVVDVLGIMLAAFGIIFEAVADQQMHRFKAQADSSGQVMQSGLWHYSRHPNYFGEFCTWWGLFLIALGAGAWWSIISPLVMSLLLLRVSGVTLLEKDIGERRPAYRSYIETVNAFFPGPRRAPGAAHAGKGAR